MLEKALKLAESKLGTHGPLANDIRACLASAYQTAQRPKDAIPLFEGTLTRRISEQGADSPGAMKARNDLACAYQNAKRPHDALATFRENLKFQSSKLGDGNAATLRTREFIAMACSQIGQSAEATRVLNEGLQLAAAELGHDHREVLVYQHNLGGIYMASGRSREAIENWEALLPLTLKRFGLADQLTLMTISRLVDAYGSLDRWREAEHLLRDSINRRRKSSPQDDSMLASGLVGRGWDCLNRGSREWQS